MSPEDGKDARRGWAGRVLGALRVATGRALGSDSAVTVLFSGGIDSGLLAHLLPRGPSVELLTVGVTGSPDLEHARWVAPRFEGRWRGVELGGEEVARQWRAAPEEVRRLSEPNRSVQFALGVAFASARPGPVLLGQGADELFGGYAHFVGLTAERAEERADVDLRRLLEEEWPRTVRLAGGRGLELRAPYLDPEVRALVRSIPAEVRFGGAERKPLLREVARAAGLASEVSERPKKAMQYGSGLAREVRRLAATPADPPPKAPRGFGSPLPRPARERATEGP